MRRPLPTEPLLDVDIARERVLERVPVLESVEVRLEDAIGFVVARDVTAPHPLPRFDNSAMDGYAVRRADIAGASEAVPIALALVGEVRAGDPGDISFESGSCVRIMTGAIVPPDGDSVVPVEDTAEEDSKVWIRAEPPPGGHIRPAGDDVAEGALVVSAATDIGAGEVALLASLGCSPVSVFPRPRVAVVVTGDGLVAPEDDPGPGRIRDSNSYALKALVEEAGADPVTFRVVADDLESTMSTLEQAATTADLVVSAGGVSVGRYDFVKKAVEELGAIDLWRVAMQPGKPVVSGRVGDTPFLGLPGNPVSIHVGFEQFVRPAIRKLRGSRALLRPLVTARLTEGVTKRPGRLHFVRVSLRVEDGIFFATPTGPQGSHIQSSLIGCHGVARFDIDEIELPKGAEVEVEVWRLPEVL